VGCSAFRDRSVFWLTPGNRNSRAVETRVRHRRPIAGRMTDPTLSTATHSKAGCEASFWNQALSRTRSGLRSAIS
jgi:hypothetical protein